MVQHALRHPRPSRGQTLKTHQMKDSQDANALDSEVPISFTFLEDLSVPTKGDPKAMHCMISSCASFFDSSVAITWHVHFEFRKSEITKPWRSFRRQNVQLTANELHGTPFLTGRTHQTECGSQFPEDAERLASIVALPKMPYSLVWSAFSRQAKRSTLPPSLAQGPRTKAPLGRRKPEQCSSVPSEKILQLHDERFRRKHECCGWTGRAAGCNGP